MSRFSDLIGTKQPTPEVLAEVMPESVVEEVTQEPELLTEQQPQLSRRKKKRNSSGF